MAIDQHKYEHNPEKMLRDVRPLLVRVADALASKNYSAAVFLTAGASIYFNEWAFAFADLIMLCLLLFFLWLKTRSKELAFKLPLGARFKDPNNGRNGKAGKAEGILYMGNVERTNEEVWFTNSDARTHILYLGTTGAGKTEGLKSTVTNAMAWGSGFVYVDGKADTDLWSSLSSLVRRFGRDDDLLVLNYMTGNSDVAAPSNTMNPFSSGSASYLTNMLVSLMPDSGGDNAMWAERAISLVSAMMPVLTWKRDNQDMQLSVKLLRDSLSLNRVIRLARDEAVPEEIRSGINGYLETLPGFVASAYDDNGDVKPPEGGGPPPDTQTASQQHGYLAMQFTRSLQSLGDDYGYIFDTQAADVDMVDVVLNRRILIVLIPALEKSGDEIANLGKIVAATIKGMMGSALGSTVEGSSATVIENKPTHSSTPFMTVFDEVGYYTAEGMAVMAAQARSLGFCLIFSGQDLPAMKKRVREEANSITANCNIKIFGKLEDPTETKEFFEKTVGSALVTEVSGFQMSGGTKTYLDTQQAGVQSRPRANYEELRGFKEGQAVVTYGEAVVSCGMFYSNPGFAKAMRVTRFLSLPPTDDELMKNADSITKLRDLMVNKSWRASRADVEAETPDEIDAIAQGFGKVKEKEIASVDRGICALVEVHALNNDLSKEPVAPPTPPAGQQQSGGAPMNFFKDGQTEKPAAPPRAKMKRADLPKEIRSIVENAGKEASAKLFKKPSENEEKK
ncbi:MAG: type IV secretion protein IcmO [Micavibrio sp. TMED27]|nr:type IV secretion protein IcmO [Micavibrio sp.]OUT91499.1 MAG: type IV secretion protein IcmO [Micavibrio sp. TMED27]|tara:strand:- start:12468 stop:14672 length:2205 start_codon:yes stop_codon:yes gene_type:complete